MSQLQQLLGDVAISCGVSAASKKKALEAMAALLARSVGSVEETRIFDSLIARERLGSTGVGDGIAIPHGRLAELERSAGALLVLQDGIDYDAIDGEPVFIMFGLLVPEACSDDHLQILAGLAEMFSDAELRSSLRSCQGEEAIRETMMRWQSPSRASA